jgi:hypothetical protein
MEEDHPAITSLHRATYGMMLFAIPHKGLVMDDIQQMLVGDGRHPRGQLLQQISSKSDLLIHQLADSKNLIQGTVRWSASTRRSRRGGWYWYVVLAFF